MKIMSGSWEKEMRQLELSPLSNKKLWQITHWGVNREKFGDCTHASVHSDIFEDKMDNKKWNKEFAIEDRNKSSKNDSCDWRKIKNMKTNKLYKNSKKGKKFPVK
jgi:hypothetical protein